MKKYIFSVLMAAMAAFTFISCEDVPEPYTLPTQPGAPTTPEVATQGTEASPYTVTDAKTVKTGTGKYIKGYIVGYVPDKALNEAIFGDASSAETAPTNILLAAKADEKEVNNCMPIQLPAGDLRTALNLKDNPGNLKKELIICGNIETYFGATGLKSATYAKINGKEIGKKPGDTTPGTDLKGEAKGDGSEANPFNSVAAQKYTAALEAGKATDKEFYIKGKVQSIKEQFSASHGNGSFYIADDANSTQFYIFRIYYFGGEKWKEGDMTLKEGDEIVVCAKLINYMGNTPETNQGGKLISVNGKTSGEGGSETPDTPSKPDTPATGEGLTIDGTTVTLSNAAATTTGASVELDLNAAGLVNQAAVETVKFSDGSTVTFDANGQENGPKFYTNTKGVRVYANNKLIFKGIKKIKQIVMTCDSYNGTNYVGNATATIEFSGTTATYTNLFTETTGGGVQLRVKTIKIVYSE
mgnify:CR=1 FL=1|jgi:uncharacterized protein YdeI (BOF family)